MLCHAQVLWVEEVARAVEQGELRTGPYNFADRVFENEINSAIRDTQQVRLSLAYVTSAHNI
jgi:hypothetical protein